MTIIHRNQNPTPTNLSKIVLVGNPNVGKSVFFNRFTGSYVEVSNYPGTTVDISRAVMDNMEIIDTPGIYGIGNYNDEEIIAKNIILQADTIINIVSALSLERDLFLTQQLIDLGFPMIVVLNQIDEAQSKGIKIDVKILENELGVKVFPTIAIKNQGIDDVKNNIVNANPGIIGIYLDKFLDNTENSQEKRCAKILEYEDALESRDFIYSERRKRINEIIDKILSETDQGISLSTFIGKLLLNPVIGLISSIIVLFLLYKIIGVFIAGNVVDFLEKKLIIKYYSPWITGIFSHIATFGPINQIFVGEFGLLTMTVQYLLGVLLPLIVGFNIFMAILEDSGYLPRLAVLTDKYLNKIGLNGRAIIPIVLGFGCISMATLTTRILGSKRERTIATAILGLTIPCSAQLGIIVGLIAVSGGFKAWIIYLASIFTIFVLIGTVLNKLLPGKSTDLLIDLPPMRIPVMKNIIDKTYSKTWLFLLEATPLFFLGSFLITMLQITGGLNYIHRILTPLTVNILHLPPETASIFIMGIIRRDFGAAGLAKMAGLGGTHATLSPSQILVSLIVITLFVPCIASVVVLFKEKGFKEASLIWLGSWVMAFIAGGIITRILELLSWFK